ncbi:MAG: flagellin lysine-N-methylase, partial [Clostridia bacterium]|nr:flagellin lysine-N-methylase [Clostridia bacterium]
MKEYILSYYPNFKCVASECKHTCCAGWDMYIDKKTLNDYKNEKSVFSATLLKGINFKKSRFKTDKNGRCAFLNGDGLCEIIKNLGEQSLCQICRDHPRFKCYFENGEETGLGFCCEQATKIILSYKEKITPKLIKDDENERKQSFIQEQVLNFRQIALDIVQDRTKTVEKRTESLLSLCKAKVNSQDFKKILDLSSDYFFNYTKFEQRLQTAKDEGNERDIESYQEAYDAEKAVRENARYGLRVDMLAKHTNDSKKDVTEVLRVDGDEP